MRGPKSFPKGTLMVHMLHCSMDTKEEASMMWASWQYHSEGGGQEGGRKGPASSSPGTHPHLGFSGRILRELCTLPLISHKEVRGAEPLSQRGGHFQISLPNLTPVRFVID